MSFPRPANAWHRSPRAWLTHPSILNPTSTSSRRFGTRCTDRRTFSTTPCTAGKVRRSPIARRQAQKSWESTPFPVQWTREGLLRDPIGAHPRQAQATLKSLAPHLDTIYDASVKDNVIPKSLKFDIYKEAVHKLIVAAYAHPPSALVIRGISKDADLVYRIGRTIAVSLRDIDDWILSATAMAGARYSTIFVANRYLQFVNFPPRTSILNEVERLALQEKDQRAMLVHAKVLIRRDQHDEAIPLVEEVMQNIYPTQMMPSIDEDPTLMKTLEPPWELRSILSERSGDHSMTEELVHMAAHKYNDPNSLVHIAQLYNLKWQKLDKKRQPKEYLQCLEKYEEYMNKAASSGDGEACRKLANFYYLTFHGKLPTRGELDGLLSKAGAIGKWLSNYTYPLFGRGFSRAEYELRAMDWYELASLNGSSKAAMIFAMLLREKGILDVDMKEEFLEIACRDSDLDRWTKELRERWTDKSYEPKISMALLDT